MSKRTVSPSDYPEVHVNLVPRDERLVWEINLVTPNLRFPLWEGDSNNEGTLAMLEVLEEFKALVVRIPAGVTYA